jgi:hypothetical protein
VSQPGKYYNPWPLFVKDAKRPSFMLAVPLELRAPIGAGQEDSTNGVAEKRASLALCHARWVAI